MESLDTIKRNVLLRESELFKGDYEKVQSTDINTFNDISITSIDDWYNSLLNKYDCFNKLQIKNIQGFFTKLKFILYNIDPNKLNIENSLVEEVDLMLWRESSNGVSKIVFDEYGQVVYMFNGNDGKKQKGIFNQNVDMEKLLYRFISK